MSDTHYGDEDPEVKEDPEDEEELFQTARSLGWTVHDIRDKAFGERYKAWLERQEM